MWQKDHQCTETYRQRNFPKMNYGLQPNRLLCIFPANAKFRRRNDAECRFLQKLWDQQASWYHFLLHMILFIGRLWYQTSPWSRCKTNVDLVIQNWGWRLIADAKHYSNKNTWKKKRRKRSKSRNPTWSRDQAGPWSLKNCLDCRQQPMQAGKDNLWLWSWKMQGYGTSWKLEAICLIQRYM